MERYYWFVLEDHSPAMLLTTIITQWTPKVLCHHTPWTEVQGLVPTLQPGR